jgi:phosphoserine phosphatase RsbU/P
MTPQHRLLQRQVKKHLGGDVPPELQSFITAVDEAYAGQDADRAMIERTLELSSRELREVNEAVRAKQRDLAQAMEQIMESLQYASRLQRAQLPQTERFCDRFSDFSVLWQPRDTIGGDLWWISPGDALGRFSVALVDCTGHGVPGAMLSLLASTSLAQIYSHTAEPSPAKALSMLDQAIRRGLNQDKPGADSDDGCDAAIVQINPLKGKVLFAGCRIDLFYADDENGVFRLGSDRFSLGYPGEAAPRPTLHEVDLLPSRKYLMTTDGLVDQVGLRADGSRRSFGFAQLMTVLNRTTRHGCVATTQALTDSLSVWQGDQVRRDDVTVITFSLGEVASQRLTLRNVDMDVEDTSEWSSWNREPTAPVQSDDSSSRKV